MGLVVMLAIVVLSWWQVGKRTRKIDDLPIYVTCQSVTFAMLSSEVNDSVAHEVTQ